MEPRDFIVSRIEGEYAYLSPVDSSDDEIFVALYLLPSGVDVGSKVHFEMFEYTLID